MIEDFIVRCTPNTIIALKDVRKMEMDTQNNRVIIHWSNGDIEFLLLSEGGQALWDVYCGRSIPIFAG